MGDSLSYLDNLFIEGDQGGQGAGRYSQSPHVKKTGDKHKPDGPLGLYANVNLCHFH